MSCGSVCKVTSRLKKESWGRASFTRRRRESRVVIEFSDGLHVSTEKLINGRTCGLDVCGSLTSAADKFHSVNAWLAPLPLLHHQSSAAHFTFASTPKPSGAIHFDSCASRRFRWNFSSLHIRANLLPPLLLYATALHYYFW